MRRRPHPSAGRHARLPGRRRSVGWRRRAAISDLIGWLREQNRHLLRDESRQVAWFGLDLYSLFRSMEAVLQFLDKVDPEAAARARARYACFDHFSDNSQAYGYAASTGRSQGCERCPGAFAEVKPAGHSIRQGRSREFFHAEQNARLVKNAEEYHHAVRRARRFLEPAGPAHDGNPGTPGSAFESPAGKAKIIIWATILISAMPAPLKWAITAN